MLRKALIIAICGIIVAGCANSGSTPTAPKSGEMTVFVGHLEASADKAVTLRNPKNGHMKTFTVTNKTVFEVDGSKAYKLPVSPKDDSRNCRVTVAPGTSDATKIEFRTK